MTDIPRSINEVTNNWLSEILGNPVSNFQVTFLEGGVLSDAFKLHNIEYESASDSPTSLVLKIANAVDDRREYALANRAYIKEVEFFRSLINEVPIGTPEVYAVLDDGSDDYEYFVIAMEDLTAHSQVFDQVDDPPDEPFVRKINDEIADLHAHFWEADTLQLDWLKLPNDEYQFPLDGGCRQCPENVDTYMTLWEKMFGQSPYTGFDALRPLTDILTGPYCIQLVDYMNGKLSARPRTLTHGDLRADNIFRSNGPPVQDSKLTYIDWQLLQPGPPGPEFTQSWQHSLAPEIRRKDLDFLKAYHDRRIALAPQSANYSYENLVEDYRMAFVLWWMALISLGAATIPVFDQPEGQRMKALWGQGLGYMFHAMQDHNCLDLVEQYLAEVK